jgi:hypothetical protein
MNAEPRQKIPDLIFKGTSNCLIQERIDITINFLMN